LRLQRVIPPSRRPAALVGAGTLIVAGTIFGNALFLQGGRHPAPLFKPDADSVTSDRVPAGRDTLVEALQTALRDRGFYAGPIDGVAGNATASAIRAFESESGMEETGRATAQLLALALNQSAKARPEPAEIAAPASVGSLGQDRIAAVQSALSRAAYGQITPDGVLGPQTRDAIRRFQADHGLPLTGDISDALIVELRAAGALEGD
jgi:peptidoglycan hydrolase-like protein with peptidoglycan-binding domain